MSRVLTHKFLPLLSFLLIFLAVMHAGIQETAAFYIWDDPAGGDCAYIGLWDARTKTCSLMTDLEQSVSISSDGVTLDGNGHTIRGVLTAPCSECHWNTGDFFAPGGGVILYGVSGVTITHVTVENFENGIDVHNVTNAVITHNKLINNHTGIWLNFSHQNMVIANYSYSIANGIELYGSDNNKVIGNIDDGSALVGIRVVEGNYNNIIGNELRQRENKDEHGIRIFISHDNTVAGNWIEDMSLGLYMDQDSELNTLMNNNFVNNSVQAKIELAGNAIMGNYWSDFDSSGEGCFDMDSNGMCEAPYEFYGGEDASAKVTFTVAAANVEIKPPVIKTRTQDNKMITAYIEIPGYAPEEVTIESVRLVTANGYVWATETPSQVGDDDGDGIPDLMVKFNKEEVKMVLSPGLNEGVVTGSLAGNTFKGVVSITLK